MSLGSNKGDRRAILEGAVKALCGLLRDLRQSAVLETDPLYVMDQGLFLNTAVAGFYSGSPYELLEEIHRIEALFGRDRSQERRWGERSLDIDILLFGGLEIRDGPVLEIPHPRLKERRFALEGLLELFPRAVEPRTSRSYAAILASLPPQGIYYA